MSLTHLLSTFQSIGVAVKIIHHTQLLLRKTAVYLYTKQLISLKSFQIIMKYLCVHLNLNASILEIEGIDMKPIPQEPKEKI